MSRFNIKEHGTALSATVGTFTHEFIRLALAGKIPVEQLKYYGAGGHNEEAARRILKMMNEPVQEPILKLYKEIVLQETDGQLTIAQAKEIYKVWIYGFDNYNTDAQKIARPKTPVEIYDLAKRGTFRQIFYSLSDNFTKLALTQHQVNILCKDHKNELAKSNLILIRKNEYKKGKLKDNDFFVVYVFRYPRGVLGVDWDALQHDSRCGPDGVRVIVRATGNLGS